MTIPPVVLESMRSMPFAARLNFDLLVMMDTEADDEWAKNKTSINSFYSSLLPILTLLLSRSSIFKLWGNHQDNEIWNNAGSVEGETVFRASRGWTEAHNKIAPTDVISFEYRAQSGKLQALRVANTGISRTHLFGSMKAVLFVCH